MPVNQDFFELINHFDGKYNLFHITCNPRQMIASNMEIGDPFPTESELSAILGVSRTTIRESMKVLIATGLLTRNSKGTFVADTATDCLVEPLNVLINLKVGNVSDLFDLRCTLEVGVAQRAAKVIQPDVILQLERQVWLMQNPDASENDFQKNDIAFHLLLAQTAGNSIVIELLNAIRSVIAAKQSDTCNFKPMQDTVVESHKQLILALKAHNSERAAQCMDEHMKISHAFYGYSPSHNE